MKRSIFTFIRFKNLAVISLFTLLILPNSASAELEYHFEEDFSNPSSPNWTAEGWHYINKTAVDDTWVIENEKLVSSGDFDDISHNLLVVEDQTSIGAWSFDVLIPTGVQQSTIPKRVFNIMLSNVSLINQSISHFGDFHIEVSLNNIALEYYNGTENRFHYVTSSPLDNRDVFNHYDFIRTEDRAYVFIDGFEVINRPFPSSVGTSINYFTILTPQGTEVIFDNLQITINANDLLNELQTQEDQKDGFFKENLVIVIGIGSLLALGTVLLYFKKKN